MKIKKHLFQSPTCIFIFIFIFFLVIKNRLWYQYSKKTGH
jgi:hypothetical protein